MHDRHGGLRQCPPLARSFRASGHEVRLIAPQFVKPYVKSNKNDAADAEAICEALQRPQ
jgi:transposase